jgi:DNA-directed RNA polymerase subunit RPC12/RpoP
MMRKEEQVRCPNCGKTVYPYATVRQGEVNNINVTDVGYRCPECNYEWGFELFSDVLLWKQAEDRMKRKIKEVVE